MKKKNSAPSHNAPKTASSVPKPEPEVVEVVEEAPKKTKAAKKEKVEVVEEKVEEVVAVEPEPTPETTEVDFTGI